MDELNYVGGSFEDSDCEQYYNELTANGLHLATCPSPRDLVELCSHCSAPSQLNNIQLSSSGLYGGEQQTTIMPPPPRTYAQVAARSSGYDVEWVPLVEPMPTRRPRTISIAEAARLALQSQHRQRSLRPQRQHRGWHGGDAFLNAEDPMPATHHQRLTYAEVAQQSDEHISPILNAFGSHGFFTSTENSSGWPNQTIYRTPQQPPHRTKRAPMSHATPYPVPRIQTSLHQEVYIPTLAQPESNLNPRDPYTLVQRTGRGGHREPISLSTYSTSGTYSPLSCGTLSTASAASRARRKGTAMKDPALPFQCSDCGSTYYEKDNLTRHKRRTHSGVQERPYPCLEPDCSWRFVNPKDLKRHQQTHAVHATPAFPCPYPFCMKSYTRGDNLARHIRSEHTEDSGLGTSASNSEYVGISRRNSVQGHGS